VDAIRKVGGTVIRIVRSSGDGRHRASDAHVSETGVASLQGVDVRIENDGSIEQLWNNVEAAVIPGA
jgi:hypothetical protein